MTVPDEQIDIARDIARAFVRAELEDVLTDGADVHPEYARAGSLLAGRPEIVGSVLVEAVALAGEAVIRLAAARGVDPQQAFHDLMTTEWTPTAYAPVWSA